MKNRDEFIAMVDKLSIQFDLPFLNFSDYWLNQRKNYFYNSSHLNRKGSIIFTQDLVLQLENQQIINPRNE